MLYNTYYKFYFYFFIWCSLYIKKHHVLHIFLWWLPHFNHHLCNSQVRMIHLQSKIWRQKSLVFSVSLAWKNAVERYNSSLQHILWWQKSHISWVYFTMHGKNTVILWKVYLWDDCDMNVCLKIEIKRWLIHGISTLLIPKLQLTRFFDGFSGNESKKQERSTPCCFHIAAPITTGLECANESEDACYDL